MQWKMWIRVEVNINLVSNKADIKNKFLKSYVQFIQATFILSCKNYILDLD